MNDLNTRAAKILGWHLIAPHTVGRTGNQRTVWKGVHPYTSLQGPIPNFTGPTADFLTLIEFAKEKGWNVTLNNQIHWSCCFYRLLDGLIAQESEGEAETLQEAVTAAFLSLFEDSANSTNPTP